MGKSCIVLVLKLAVKSSVNLFHQVKIFANMSCISNTSDRRRKFFWDLSLEKIKIIIYSSWSLSWKPSVSLGTDGMMMMMMITMMFIIVARIILVTYKQTSHAYVLEAMEFVGILCMGMWLTTFFFTPEINN